MTPVLVALIVAIPSVVGPLLLSLLNSKQRRDEREEDWGHRQKERQADWDRQDKVAARAEAAVAAVDKRAKEAAEKVEVVAQVARTADTKLDTIHALVNSQMTAAIQAELDATERELVTLKELIDLRQKGGQEPTNGVLVAVKATQAKVEELKKNLADRAKQTEVAEQEA